jgi:nicotinamide-nucleotide amidase
MTSPARRLLSLARRDAIRIATAESCTGGLLAGAITTIAGASDVFDRGFITYSNGAKIELLGVEPRVLDQFGAVSEEVAHDMAEGALRQSSAHLALSVTGIAGPGGSDHKPEGLVCFGLARKGHPTRTETVNFGAQGRSNVRRASVQHALCMMVKALETVA